MDKALYVILSSDLYNIGILCFYVIINKHSFESYMCLDLVLEC